MVERHGHFSTAVSAARSPRTQGPGLARQIAAAAAALLLAAGLGSACGLVIAKARESASARLENPWSSQGLRPAR